MSKNELKEHERLREYQLVFMMRSPDSRDEFLEAIIKGILTKGCDLSGAELHESRPGPQTLIEEGVIYFLADPKKVRRLINYFEKYVSVENTTFRLNDIRDRHTIYARYTGWQIRPTEWWRNTDIIYTRSA